MSVSMLHVLHLEGEAWKQNCQFLSLHVFKELM